MVDSQTARHLITGLEVFRGRGADEYGFLVGPLSEFVYRNEFLNLPEIDRLARAILTEATHADRAETTHTQTKPSVTAQFLADQIDPWIKDIRQTLFRSKSAPFNRIEDAQTWCDEAKKGIDEWRKRLDEWRKRGDEWRARWKAMRKKYPLIEESIDTLEAWRKLGQALGIRWSAKGIPGDFPTQEELQEELWQLNEFERSLKSPPELDEQTKVYFALVDKMLEIIKVTGFTFTSVEMYILANASPVLPPLSYGIIDRTHSLPSGTSVVNRFARVTIRSDVTFEGLRSAYRSIRRELGITRSKSHTTKHLQLYQMVKRRDSIPSGKGTVAFWESLRHEWNRRYPKAKYTTWKGVKAAYDRLCRKMGDRFQAKPSGHNSAALDLSYTRKQKEAQHERTHTSKG